MANFQAIISPTTTLNCTNAIRQQPNVRLFPKTLQELSHDVLECPRIGPSLQNSSKSRPAEFFTMLHREIARVKESRYQRVLGCSFAIGPLSSCLAPSAIYSRLETLDEIPYCSRPSVIYGDNGEYMLGCSQEFLGAWSKFFSQCSSKPGSKERRSHDPTKK